MKYKKRVPCGKVLGHGCYCQDGHLCDSCEYITELEREKHIMINMIDSVVKHFNLDDDLSMHLWGFKLSKTKEQSND